MISCRATARAPGDLTPYGRNQASYDLPRLARNGLIIRIPGRNRYVLAHDGLLFAHLYTKIYDQVLRPHDHRRAQRPTRTPRRPYTLDRIVAERIAYVRVPAAA